MTTLSLCVLCECSRAPHFFLNRVLLRLNPALHSKALCIIPPNFFPFWQPVYKISATKFSRFRWRRDRQKQYYYNNNYYCYYYYYCCYYYYYSSYFTFDKFHESTYILVLCTLKSRLTNLALRLKSNHLDITARDQYVSRSENTSKEDSVFTSFRNTSSGLEVPNSRFLAVCRSDFRSRRPPAL